MTHDHVPDELRQLEQNAPEAADAVAAELQPLRARVPAAEAELEQLKTRYSAEAIAPVADNPAQASRLLAAAGITWRARRKRNAKTGDRSDNR